MSLCIIEIDATHEHLRSLYRNAQMKEEEKKTNSLFRCCFFSFEHQLKMHTLCMRVCDGGQKNERALRPIARTIVRDLQLRRLWPLAAL